MVQQSHTLPPRWWGPLAFSSLAWGSWMATAFVVSPSSLEGMRGPIQRPADDILSTLTRLRSQVMADVVAINNNNDNSNNNKKTSLFAITDDAGWNDILPLEKGSHGSAKICIPSSALDIDEEEFFEPSSFQHKLQATVQACRVSGVSSLWIEVPMTRCSLIEAGKMHEQGFQFHHAIKDKAVLNLWLREELESKIPEFSTHNVGIGALVVNSRDEVLLVRELRKNYQPWKTPTGLSELGEYLDEAAEREVLEETGIRAKFHSILGFRQAHGMAHGRSDLFFVCRLDPIEEMDEHGNVIIPQPVPQACEIETAQWVPLSEYRALVTGENGQLGHPMMAHVIKVFDEGRKITRKVVESIVPGRKPNAIYYPIEPDQEEK